MVRSASGPSESDQGPRASARDVGLGPALALAVAVIACGPGSSGRDAAPDAAFDAAPPGPCPAAASCEALGDRCAAFLSPETRDIVASGTYAVRKAEAPHFVTEQRSCGAYGMGATWRRIVLSERSDVTLDVGIANARFYLACGCPDRRSDIGCGAYGPYGETPGRFEFHDLAAGAYYLSTSPGVLTVSIQPARVPPEEARCPGREIPIDGPGIDVATFRDSLEVATCSHDRGVIFGSYSPHAMLHFDLPEARDVWIETGTTPGSRNWVVQVHPTCGSRFGSGASCALDRAYLRNAAPGRHYFAIAGGPEETAPATPVHVRVATARATDSPPADHCPGTELNDGVPTVLDVTTLDGDTGASCMRGWARDAFFRFRAPPVARDVIARVAIDAANEAVGLELRSRVAGTRIDECTAVDSFGWRWPVPWAPAWRRFSNLDAGGEYVLTAVTSANAGSLDARIVSVPHAEPIATARNDRCSEATTVPPTGGRFTGTLTGYGVDFPSGRPAWEHSADAVYRIDVAARSRLLVRPGPGALVAVGIAIRTGEACPGTSAVRLPGPSPVPVPSAGTAFEVVAPAGVHWLFVYGGASSGMYDLDLAIVPE